MTREDKWSCKEQGNTNTMQSPLGARHLGIYLSSQVSKRSLVSDKESESVR